MDLHTVRREARRRVLLERALREGRGLDDVMRHAPWLALGGLLGGTVGACRNAAAAAYTPLSEGNCVVGFEAGNAGVTTSSASITAPTDFTNAAWTKTTTTLTSGQSDPDGGTNAFLLTATATGLSSGLSQTPSNYSNISQIQYTFYVKKTTHDWIAFSQRGSAGAELMYLNLSTGATGTVGGSVFATITNVGGGWFKVVTSYVTQSASTGIKFTHVDADNSLNGTTGHAFLLYNVTIQQTRCTGFTNLASGVSWTQGTTGPQPRYSATGWQGTLPCIEFFGGQYITSTEAAALTAFSNNNPLTVYYLLQVTQPDQTGTIIGSANSGSASAANIRQYGMNTGGAGQWMYRTADAAGTAIVSSTAVSTSNANYNVFCWKHSGNDITLRLNGVAQSVSVVPTNNPATVTPNNVSIGAQVDGTPERFLLAPTTAGNPAGGRVRAIYAFAATHDGPTTTRVENYLTTYGAL